MDLFEERCALPSEEGTPYKRCARLVSSSILGDIRLWVGGPSTPSCLVSLPPFWCVNAEIRFSQLTLNLSPESHGQNVALSVLCVPHSLDRHPGEVGGRGGQRGVFNR